MLRLFGWKSNGPGSGEAAIIVTLKYNWHRDGGHLFP